MNPSKHLFDLVKSLSTAERRYFRLFATGIGGKQDSVYLKLFDIIDKSEAFDERAIIKSHPALFDSSNFSVTKAYLQTIILKSLFQFYAQSNPNFQGFFQLGEIEILFEKGQNELCLKLIKSYKNRALSEENWMVYEQLLEWESRICLKQSDYITPRKNISEQISVSKRLVTENLLKEKALALYDLYQQKLTDTSDAILKEAEIVYTGVNELNSEPLTLRAQYFSLSAAHFYFIIKKDFEQMLKTARACFQIFTQNPVFLNANKRAYNSTLTNLCNALIHNQDFEATKNQLFHLKALIENSTETFKSEMRANAITTLLNLEIIVVQNMDNKQSIAALQQEVENVVEQYGKFLSAAQLSELYINIANALFSIKDYNKAVEYVNRILQHSKDEVGKDVYMTTRLLFLLLHFELGNKALLNSSIDTTRKYLSRHNKLHSIEKLIFSFLKVPKASTILEIKSQIDASRKHKLDSLLLSLNIYHWLEEKIAQLTKKTL